MAEMRTGPVKAKIFDDIDEVDELPGAFEYYTQGDRDPAGIIFNCPCGCGRRGALAFRPHESPSWDWDGNVDEPTLSPSVHTVGHWHGWLRAGTWVSV